MKLELDVLHNLLDVYTKFNIDISKHVEEILEIFETSKTHKNNRQNSENHIFERNWTYVEKYTAGQAMIANNKFDLLLVVN